MTADTPSKPYDPESAADVTSFALDGWIDDAKLPQRSMVVYKRADLRAELDEIEREVQLAGGEASAADAARWNKIAKQIADSAVTIRVRAVNDDAAKRARADAKAEGIKAKAAAEWDDEDLAEEAVEAAEDEAEIRGLDGEERDALIRRRVVEARRAYISARWIQVVEQHLFVRLLVSPKMTVEQLRSLSEQIGSAQRDKLMQLPMQATADTRPVSAPFSQPSSQGRRGGTSSKRSEQQGRGESRR